MFDKNKFFLTTSIIISISIYFGFINNISVLAAEKFLPDTKLSIDQLPQKQLDLKTGIPKLETPLSELYLNRNQPSNISPNTLNQLEKYLIDDSVRIDIVLKDISILPAIKEYLNLINSEIIAEFENRIEAIVPVLYLQELSEKEGVLYIRRPVPVFPIDSNSQLEQQFPLADTGAYVTQGVVASSANLWHANNFTGTGINIGILDNFQYYDTAQALGELPSAMYSYGTLGLDSPHGTAVSEIIYDMAPEAILTLATPTSSTQMASYIVGLAQLGRKIISSSITYFNDEPGDGTGTVSSAINTATNIYGTLYCQAAGNFADNHWDGYFSDPNSNGYHDFASGVELNQLGIVPAGYPISLYLRWNDWPVSDQDYDLYLYYYDGSAFQPLTYSINEQSGTQPPAESIAITAPITTYYAFAIHKYNATGAQVLNILGPGATAFQYNQTSRSLVDPATADKSFSVAAEDVSTYVLESYSSIGPTYGPGGIITGGLAKPRITGFANVDTWSYGNGIFNGTSSATPHVAGAAALVLQAFPTYTPIQITQFLENLAVDQGSAGYDYLYGAGRLNLGSTPYIVTVSKDGNGSGTISSNPAGITCGTDCTENYPSGTSVILTASANVDSTASWNNCAAAGGIASGNGTDTATCTFSSLNANKTVTATFTLDTYTVTANATGSGAGSVSSNVGGINYTYPTTSTATSTALNHGSSITLTASANIGSTVSWSGCSSTGGTSTAATCTFSSLDANKTVTATFVINTYTVTPSAGANGSITPSTPQTVNHGLTTAFTVTPDIGYHINSVSGCGGSLDGNTYTTGPIIADCTVSATFAIDTFTVTPSPGANGSMTPSTPQTVNYNDTMVFTVTPDNGYRIETVTGCSGSLIGDIFTTGPVTNDCTVTATFSLGGYTVTPSAGANGSITPSTPQTVNHGLTTAFTVTPDIGYHINSVSGCGGSLDGNTYTTGPIIADCTVSATFAIDTFTVTPSPGANGSMTPSTSQTVNYNDTQIFTVTPDTGYQISSVSGCGGSLDGNTYTTSPITADCTVSATFAIATFTVTPNPGANGSITPSTPQTVNYNDTMVFTVTPDNGYRIETVTGCGGSLIGDIFTTGPVTNDCTVTATFSLGGYTVTPSAGANGTISPSTPQTVNHGLTIAFTITPDLNYHIDHVNGCGGNLVGNIYTTGPIVGDCSVSATFAIYTYELIVNITGKGLVTSDPIGISCNDDCSEMYDNGTLVTLTATPQGGSTFVGWSGDCVGTDLTCDVTVDQVRNVSAEFTSPFPWTMFLPVLTNNKQP